jgi:hypothetical protein
MPSRRRRRRRVRVVWRDGSVDLIAGNRRLEHDTAVRAEVVDGQLQFIYLGVVLREYDDWIDHAEFTAGDYPLGN